MIYIDIYYIFTVTISDKNNRNQKSCRDLYVVTKRKSKNLRKCHSKFNI